MQLWEKMKIVDGENERKTFSEAIFILVMKREEHNIAHDKNNIDEMTSFIYILISPSIYEISTTKIPPIFSYIFSVPLYPLPRGYKALSLCPWKNILVNA